MMPFECHEARDKKDEELQVVLMMNIETHRNLKLTSLPRTSLPSDVCTRAAVVRAQEVVPLFSSDIFFDV